MELRRIYDIFVGYLYEGEKNKALTFILDSLEKGHISLVDLYTHILTPALNNLPCRLEDRRMCIWQEHVISSIVRTIIECCYPYVVKEKSTKGIEDRKETAVILCPVGEYHELGARIGADYFALLGYNTIFVGSNTPMKDIIEGIGALKPKYVVISVSNYYNLIAAKKLTEAVVKEHPEVIILAGGLAFKEHEDNYRKIGAHKFIDSFDDVAALGGGD